MEMTQTNAKYLITSRVRGYYQVVNTETYEIVADGSKKDCKNFMKDNGLSRTFNYGEILVKSTIVICYSIIIGVSLYALLHRLFS